MSTEIYTKCDTLSLLNMMYRRMIGFACNFAKQGSPSLDEMLWIEQFAQLEGKSSESLSADEAFSSAEEVHYWSMIFFECAQAIYDRKIGNQENQEWQVSTIWAMYSVARMFATEFIQRGVTVAEPMDTA